jgi:hypothetical protein
MKIIYDSKVYACRNFAVTKFLGSRDRHIIVAVFGAKFLYRNICHSRRRMSWLVFPDERHATWKLAEGFLMPCSTMIRQARVHELHVMGIIELQHNWATRNCANYQTEFAKNCAATYNVPFCLISSTSSL